jgi:hypothetical protein
MHRLSHVLVGALTIGLSFTTNLSNTHALSPCATGPVSVPGLNGPPNWDSGNLAGPANPDGGFMKLHDPRWGGAPLVTFGNVGGAGEAEYRILYHGDYIYVSMHALAPSTQTGLPNRVYFGMTHGAGADDLAFLVAVDAAAGAGPGNVAQAFRRVDAATGWQVANAPGDLSGAVDFAFETDSYFWEAEPGVAWAANLKIKVRGVDGFNIPGTTGDVRTVLAMDWNLADTIVQYSTPQVLASTPVIASSLPIPSNPTQWFRFKKPGAACTGGVVLNWDDIRTTHPDGFKLYTDNPASDPDVNTFVLTPSGIAGRALINPPWPLRVKLSIADWGAQVADASNSEWTAIHGTEAATAPTDTPSSWSWAWDGGGAGPLAGSSDGATINFTCTKQSPSDAFCPKLSKMPTPGDTAAEIARKHHQCVLAELRPDPNPANTNPDLSFTNAAAYRNMDFVQLSTFSRDAKISVKGLEKLLKDKKQRELYLVVQKRNMPAHGSEPLTLPGKTLADLKRFVQHPSPSPYHPQDKRSAELLKATSARLSATLFGDKNMDSKQFAKAIEALPFEYSSASSHELLASTFPTYMMHVYYDTGRTTQRGEKAYPIYAPLVPFGYFLEHEGEFFGFNEETLGLESTELKSLGDNLFKLSLKNEAATWIQTKIIAEEKKRDETPTGTKCDCDLNQYAKIDHKHEKHTKVDHKHHCGCDLPGKEKGGSGLLLLGTLLLVTMGVRRKWRAAA